MSEHRVETDARPSWWRVVFTSGSIAKVTLARRRFRCGGHLADEAHYIEPGDRYVANALPPDHPDIGNDRWWHLRVCMACCPEKYLIPPESVTIRG